MKTGGKMSAFELDRPQQLLRREKSEKQQITTVDVPQTVPPIVCNMEGIDWDVPAQVRSRVNDRFRKSDKLPDILLRLEGAQFPDGQIRATTLNRAARPQGFEPVLPDTRRVLHQT